LKYFLHIAYNGSHFHGWQWQTNAVTVQGVIEEKLQCIFKEKINVFGCGRTDSGVHASQYVFHITIEDVFDFDLKFRLNKHLPNSIVVYEIFEVSEKKHARYHATSRTYDYFLHLYKDPVLGKHSSYYEIDNLDLEAMQKAGDLISKYNNFEAACKQPHLYHDTICKVSFAKLYVDESQKRMRFTITANRFLRGMIRILVGYLLDVGKGKISVAQFEDILANQTKMDNKRVAYPNGLYLSKITYDGITLQSQQDICSFLKIGLEG